MTRPLSWVLSTVLVVGVVLGLRQTGASLDTAIAPSVALAGSILAALAVQWSARVNSRIDAELDRITDLPREESDALGRHLADRRKSVTQASLIAALGAAVCPPCLVYFLNGSTNKNTAFAPVALMACAIVSAVLVVQVLRLHGFVSSLDTFHLEINRKLADATDRALAQKRQAEERTLPWT